MNETRRQKAIENGTLAHFYMTEVIPEDNYENYLKTFNNNFPKFTPMSKKQWEEQQNQPIEKTCYTCKHHSQQICKKIKGCLGAFGRNNWE